MTVLVQRASVMRGYFDGLQEFFLPAALRSKFEVQAHFFKEQTPYFWNDRFAARRADLQKKLDEMQSWLNEKDCELFLRGFDDEMFFFYVLKIQSVWIRLEALDRDAYIPAESSQFWKWAMSLEGGWFLWVLPVQSALAGLSKKPPIWGIPCPNGLLP